MYTGNNVKAIQSQKWLAEALVTLMKDTDYQKITVKDICDQAFLSRQTFYNVFDTKEEILHFYFQNTYRDSFNKIKAQESLSAEDVVNTFIGVIEQNYPLLKTMVRNKLTAILTAEITYGVELFTDAFVVSDERDKTFPYSKAMISGAFSQVLVYWLKQEEPLDIMTLSKLLTNFLKGNVYSFAD